MAIARQETQNHIDWRRMHALGLPAGSVRALLAVLVFATVWGMLLVRPSLEVPDYLSDLMFVIMGHYFATRKRNAAVEVPGDEPGPPPLFLPTGSIRLLLTGGSVAVAVVLYRRGVLTRIDRNPGVTTLLLVGGFLIGVILNALTGWWRAASSAGTGPSRTCKPWPPWGLEWCWSPWSGTGCSPSSRSTRSTPSSTAGATSVDSARSTYSRRSSGSITARGRNASPTRRSVRLITCLVAGRRQQSAL